MRGADFSPFFFLHVRGEAGAELDAGEGGAEEGPFHLSEEDAGGKKKLMETTWGKLITFSHFLSETFFLKKRRGERKVFIF